MKLYQGQIKIEKELQAKRAEVMILQDTATLANEARLTAISQLETLKAQVGTESYWVSEGKAKCVSPQIKQVVG